MGCCHYNPKCLTTEQQTILYPRKYNSNGGETNTEYNSEDPVQLLKNLKNRKELDAIAQFICWDEEGTSDSDEFKIDSFPPARSVCSIALSILSELSHTESMSIESIGIEYIPDLISLISGSDPNKRIYALLFFQKILRRQRNLVKESLVRSNVFKVLLPLINDTDKDLGGLALNVCTQIFKAFPQGQREFFKYKGEWFIAEHFRRLDSQDDKYLQVIDSVILLVIVTFRQNNHNYGINKNMKKVLETGLINHIASQSLSAQRIRAKVYQLIKLFPSDLIPDNE